ncbi:SAM-dependent methyltransferase [Streptomyces sp. BE147]|uniref:SAM-dependent methyltransferase n=1 Tax=Streptomyces sp. BE147 TaxID=3002524 RepID=UPI002E78D7B2|nr:SAM-dependent methyltransferase [Streptomyces sp. BE147]MEE1741162.1 SAM-dependent methyltransferase [Streptomyces sp. BE147]
MPPRTPRNCTQPSGARIYDALLSRTPYAGDSEILSRLTPAEREYLSAAAGINRLHSALAARHLADYGFEQFLDLGCGFPSPQIRPRSDEPLQWIPHVHEEVVRIRPGAPVVYVDIHADVIGHMRADTDDAGVAVHVQGDLRHMTPLLTALDRLGHLDLRRPLAVLAHDVLSWMGLEEAVGSMRDLRELVARGSALSITHPTDDLGQVMSKLTPLCKEADLIYQPRSRDVIERFFGDWELLAPGLVPTAEWSREHWSPAGPDLSGAYAGIAVKPADQDRNPRP